MEQYLLNMTTILEQKLKAAKDKVAKVSCSVLHHSTQGSKQSSEIVDSILTMYKWWLCEKTSQSPELRVVCKYALGNKFPLTILSYFVSIRSKEILIVFEREAVTKGLDDKKNRHNSSLNFWLCQNLLNDERYYSYSYVVPSCNERSRQHFSSVSSNTKDDIQSFAEYNFTWF